jgi:hypothetical protein
MRHPLTFEAWKALLRNDCIALEKLQTFDTAGEVILKLLCENGADPTVEGIVRNGLPGTHATDGAETSRSHSQWSGACGTSHQIRLCQTTLSALPAVLIAASPMYFARW